MITVGNYTLTSWDYVIGTVVFVLVLIYAIFWEGEDG